MIDILAVGHAPILSVNRALYRALAALGWSIELAIPNIQPWRGPPVDPAGEGDPPLHMLAPTGRNTRFWRFEGLAELVRARRPRILFLENEPDSRMAFELGGLAKQIGAKLVCVTNENDLPPPLASLLRGRLRPALRSLRSRAWSLVASRRVDHVLAICDDGVTDMTALGFGGRVTKMPLGFDPQLFRRFDEPARAAVRARLGLSSPTIAYFGRLIPIKGVHILVEALARIADLDWQFLLDSVNENDAYVAGLQRLIAARGIAPRTVQFHASHAQMPEVMNAADIVAAPSIWKEQYGRVVPEAMACGCAVVIAAIGAMPELLGECGLKVPSGDVEALAGALRRLLEHPQERQDFGRAAALRAQTALSLPAQVTVVDGVLRALVRD